MRCGFVGSRCFLSPQAGTYVRATAQTWHYLFMSSSDDRSPPSEIAVGDLPLTVVKTRPDPYFFCMKSRPLSTKFGSAETLVTILKCVVLILTFEKWSKLFNRTMFYQFKNLNHTFYKNGMSNFNFQTFFTVNFHVTEFHKNVLV